MMRALRSRLWLPVGLALVLLGAWIGIGILHGHPHDPSCQVCSALHYTAAELVAPPHVGEPVASVVAFLAATAHAAAPSHSSSPQGRAPPIA